MKQIFISRNIDSSSPILKVIGDNILVDQSLIEFSALDFDTPPADWIFFYSRNGVKFFFENGNYELYPYLWACMSEGTADELSQYVTDISFIGSGVPDDVASSFEKIMPPSEITCFIRAEKSLDSIHKRLDRENDFSLPVYKNTPITNIPEQNFDILIFTSPMNVDAWLSKREFNDEIIISIGNTTADHLSSFGIKNVLIAETPSEESIAKCLLPLL